jgi:hypothetical protein
VAWIFPSSAAESISRLWNQAEAFVTIADIA